MWYFTSKILNKLQTQSFNHRALIGYVAEVSLKSMHNTITLMDSDLKTTPWLSKDMKPHELHMIPGISWFNSCNYWWWRNCCCLSIYIKPYIQFTIMIFQVIISQSCWWQQIFPMKILLFLVDLTIHNHSLSLWRLWTTADHMRSTSPSRPSIDSIFGIDTSFDK